MQKILVVEDESLIRLHIADTFRDCGFSVVEAVDGGAALRILEQDASIAAVFTDITLPDELDGFRLARWIRANRPGLPVILSSGEITAAHAQRIGRDVPFFAKPCDYTEVAAFIRRRLEDPEG